MRQRRSSEQGFMLLALVVVCFLILLALTVAAPTMARRLQREREEQTVQRGHEYQRAIRLYYRKFGHYPGSIEQLEKTNNIRFLRQRYVDPLTGKDDWRLIHLGENKTQVTGFFGQPLSGLPGPGAGGGTAGSGGSAAVGGGFTSIASTLLGGGSGPGTGTSGAVSATGAAGSTGDTDATGATGATGTTGATGATGTTGSTGGLGLGSSSGTGGLIMGVGLSHPGDALIEVNGQSTYDTWEFLYDPRSEPRPNLGGGLGTAGATGSTGSGFGTGSGIGGASGATGATGATGGTGPGVSGGQLP